MQTVVAAIKKNYSYLFMDGREIADFRCCLLLISLSFGLAFVSVHILKSYVYSACLMNFMTQVKTVLHDLSEIFNF